MSLIVHVKAVCRFFFSKTLCNFFSRISITEVQESEPVNDIHRTPNIFSDLGGSRTFILRSLVFYVHFPTVFRGL